MASKSFLALGKAMDVALQRLRQILERRISSSMRATVIVDLMASAYMLGANTAWVLHGSYLGLPNSLPAATFDQWRAQALEQGSFVANRYRAQLEATGGMSVLEVQRWAQIAGSASLWRGQDTAAQMLAKQAAVEWKTWVRAYPREEERLHSVLEGVTIPIDDEFVLPNGVRVFGPRDWSSYPEPAEWVNCGHALTYSMTATNEDMTQTLKTLYRSPRV